MIIQHFVSVSASMCVGACRCVVGIEKNEKSDIERRGEISYKN